MVQMENHIALKDIIRLAFQFWWSRFRSPNHKLSTTFLQEIVVECVSSPHEIDLRGIEDGVEVTNDDFDMTDHQLNLACGNCWNKEWKIIEI